MDLGRIELPSKVPSIEQLYTRSSRFVVSLFGARERAPRGAAFGSRSQAAGDGSMIHPALVSPNTFPAGEGRVDGSQVFRLRAEERNRLQLAAPVD